MRPVIKYVMGLKAGEEANTSHWELVSNVWVWGMGTFD